MKNYGCIDDKFYVEVSGRIWVGYSLVRYPDEWAYIKSTPCDCNDCLLSAMKDVMRKDGIIFRGDVGEKSPSFYHDGSNPPSNEEWDEIRRAYGFKRPRKSPPKQSPPKQQSRITNWLNRYPTDFGEDYQ